MQTLNETSQGVILIQRNSTPPIGEIADITVYLKALDGCGSLSIKALLELQNILQIFVSIAASPQNVYILLKIACIAAQMVI